MHALDVIDNALQWETERQNRLHQQAVEQRKKPAPEESWNVGAEAAAGRPDTHAQAPAGMSDWPDKVRHIPDMRSALIPLDEATEGGDWSKPFSLVKADMEPWLSFHHGYRQSRLFLQTCTFGDNPLDHSVRALLDLKQLASSLIVEPPVQINRQVEYHDFDEQAASAEERRHSGMLLRLAQETHVKQLAKAVEQGRQLGDRLYDAMMGEGYANLVKAWERVHGRKPSVDELHMMLSTGRTRLERRQPAAKPAIPLEERPPRLEPVLPVMRKIPVSSVPPAGETRPEMVAPTAIQTPQQHAPAFTPASPAMPKAQPDGRRRLPVQALRYALHGTAIFCSAAAITYFWVL